MGVFLIDFLVKFLIGRGYNIQAVLKTYKSSDNLDEFLANLEGFLNLFTL